MQNRKSLLGVVMLVFFALAGVPAQAAYSAANVKGSYSVLFNEWTEPTGSEGAVLGMVDFDGVGAVSGSFTVVNSTGLDVLTISSGSSYSVKANGSGSMTLVLTGTGSPGTVQIDFVLNSVSGSIAKSLQMLAVNSKTTNTNVVAGTAVATGLSGSASAANLKGAYSFLLNIWTAGTQQAILGTFSFDGASKVTLTYTQQQGPGSVSKGTGSGTYSVTTDGTGSMNLALSNGNSATEDFAINSVSAGVSKGFQTLETDSNTTFTVTGAAVHQ